MEQVLQGKTIAVLVANGFDEHQMTEIQKALLALGAMPKIISTDNGVVNGWHGKSWGHYFPVDKHISEALGADYDGLVVPGGARSAGKLSQTAHTRRIIGAFVDAMKPAVVLDEGLSLLAMTPKVAKRQVAATGETVAALEAHGAVVKAEEKLVIDRGLITAYAVEDLPALIETVTQVFTETLAPQQQAA